MTGERLKEYGPPPGRGYITWEQMRAGEMWAGDWSACQPSTRHRSMAKEPSCQHKGAGFDMGGIAAIRYQRAARFLGPDLYKIAKAFCIDDKPIYEPARERGERDDAGGPLLRLALDTLARFYRPDLPDEKQAGRGGGSVGAEWLDWLEDQSPVVMVTPKPRKATDAVVTCYKCGRGWRYGEPLPECGRAGCRAPGTMILSTVGGC